MTGQKNYVIGWYSNNTSASGSGTARMEFNECQRLCNEANQIHPELTHFVVDIESKTVPAWEDDTRKLECLGAIEDAQVRPNHRIRP